MSVHTVEVLPSPSVVRSPRTVLPSTVPATYRTEEGRAKNAEPAMCRAVVRPPGQASASVREQLCSCSSNRSAYQACCASPGLLTNAPPLSSSG